MVTGRDVINQLKKHLGESGSFIWKWYGGGSGWAWCNATVCWAFAQAGAANLYYGGKKVSYCPTSIKWCQINYAQIPLELADAGDVIYFDWEPNGVPNHIGFIRERGTHSVAYTIEGNAGSPSRVRSLARPAKYIQAVFRVPYPMASKPTSYKLTVDGIFNQKTIYCFQHMLKVKEDGILGRSTVKAIQKLAGTTQDGHWGKKTSTALQKILGVKQDGDFGPNSVKALQTMINRVIGGSTPTPTEKKVYSGTFPSLIPPTARMGVECAYAKNTSSKTFKYQGGKPKGAYKIALNKAYPDRSTWGKQTRAGASCDVFVGTCLRASGVDKKFPRGLSEQIPWLKKNYKTTSNAKNGDILLRSNHIAIAVDIKGTLYVANAHHEAYGGTYGIIEKKGSFSKIYRPDAEGTALRKGDKFIDVEYLQKFLNWYGGYKLVIDCDFGDATKNAVMDFQKKEGLTIDGEFGKESLKKAKTIKK